MANCQFKNFKLLMRLPFFTVFCCCFFLACNQPIQSGETGDEEIKVATKMITYFNAHDWKKMAALYTESALFPDPSFGKKTIRQTHQQTAEKYAQLQSMFPDIKDSIVSINGAEENKIVLEFISTGKAKDITVLLMHVCSILTIKNGKITEDHTYYDNAGQ